MLAYITREKVITMLKELTAQPFSVMQIKVDYGQLLMFQWL